MPPLVVSAIVKFLSVSSIVESVAQTSTITSPSLTVSSLGVETATSVLIHFAIMEKSKIMIRKLTIIISDNYCQQEISQYHIWISCT